MTKLLAMKPGWKKPRPVRFDGTAYFFTDCTHPAQNAFCCWIGDPSIAIWEET